MSPFVTAVGGTRLTLGKGNARVSETVWNDSAYGVKAAGGGALSRDITTGNNDLDGVGCCQATVGYDLASGLGVPNWAVLPATLPSPGSSS